MTSEPLTTCLWFDDQAEEAARFYTGVFKDCAWVTCTGTPRRARARPGR